MSKSDKSKSQASILKAQLASKDPAHNKLGRIDDLPEALKNEVHDSLKRYPPKVACDLIRDAGHNLDIAPITLQHLLEKYRRERIDPAEIVNPYMIARLTTELKTRVNCFSAMSDLMALQQERIRVALMGELEGEIDPEVNKQIHLMTRMVKVYSDMAVKAGLMQTFVTQYEKECREEEDAHTLEIESIFGRVVRSLASNNPEIFNAVMNVDIDQDESGLN